MRRPYRTETGTGPWKEFIMGFFSRFFGADASPDAVTLTPTAFQ